MHIPHRPPALYISYCASRFLPNKTLYGILSPAAFFFFPFNRPLSFTVQAYSWQIPASPTVEWASLSTIDHRHYKKPILRRSRVATTAPPEHRCDRMMKGWGNTLEIEVTWKKRADFLMTTHCMRISKEERCGEGMWFSVLKDRWKWGTS